MFRLGFKTDGTNALTGDIPMPPLVLAAKIGVANMLGEAIAGDFPVHRRGPAIGDFPGGGRNTGREGRGLLAGEWEPCQQYFWIIYPITR